MIGLRYLTGGFAETARRVDGMPGTVKGACGMTVGGEGSISGGQIGGRVIKTDIRERYGGNGDRKDGMKCDVCGVISSRSCCITVETQRQAAGRSVIDGMARYGRWNRHILE